MSTTKQGHVQRGFVTLDQVVKSALMDIGESMHRYEQFRHWVIEGYLDFHLDLAQEVKTAYLPLTAWKSVQLPLDYVDFVQIGIVVNGEIRVFTNDDRIALPDQDLIQADPPTPTEEETLPNTNYPYDASRYYFYNLTNRGEDPGQLYGLTVKGNGVGYYRINTERREIQFSPKVAGDTSIYLEYISDGINPCEKTVVNIYAAKLLKLYAHWQRHTYSKSSTGLEKREAKDNYWNEFYKVQNRIQKITAADVLEVMRDSYRLIQSV